MARSIPIIQVNQSTLNPGSFVIGVTPDNATGNWTSVYKGKFYRLETSPYTESPFYTGAIAGYQLIQATEFDVVDNASYAGHYTVYTPVDAPDESSNPSSAFSGGQTTISVNEFIGVPDAPGDLTSGSIENVSTYYIFRQGGAAVVVPPGVTVADYPLEFTGRNFSGYGEVLNLNFQELMQNFSSATAPANPSIGMMWWDTVSATMKVWNGSWVLVNAGAFAPVNSYKHVQSAPSSTWTVTHNLAALSPFIVNHSFFVDIGGGVYKPILPQDVTYTSANVLTVTFSTAYTGFALVRL